MMRRIRRLAPAVCLLALAVSPPAASAGPAPAYTTIQRAFIREEFRQVASLAQIFIAENPNVPETPRVWLWLALSLDRLERSNEALAELEHLRQHLSAEDPLVP